MLTRDNLGSPHTLLDELGQVTYLLGFDAHGSRRQGYDPRTLIEGYNPIEDVTERGFTGHEHLDELGVIHMNGRIYDPQLGRFLQADPLIQDLSNPQSLNRYSYVFNNPLAYTDPSGYGVSRYLRPILSIGIAIFTGNWASSLYAVGNTAGALAVSVGGGALAGAIATGSGKGALIGAFTGAAAFGVGSSIAGGGSNGISNTMAKWGAQALAGGLAGQVNHGNFGAGFMSGFSVEWEFGFEGSQAPIAERPLVQQEPQDLVDLNARDATPEQYALMMGPPDKWFAYESSPTLRATVPGQVSWDNAVTAWENDAYGKAVLYSGAMLGEQVLTVASFGYGTPASQSIRSFSSGSVSRFFGPKGPVFGTSYFRGPGNAGLLNRTKVRLGWSFRKETGRLNFSLRIGKNWHSDRYFNPLSIKPPPR